MSLLNISERETGLAVIALARMANEAFGEDGGKRYVLINHMEFSIECIKAKNSYTTERFVITNLVTEYKTEVRL